MNLPTMAFRLIVAEPILQEGSVKRCRAEGVEAVAFAGVHDGQLARHSEDGAFGGRVGELRRGGADEGDDGGRVDDAAAGFLVFA